MMCSNKLSDGDVKGTTPQKDYFDGLGLAEGNTY